MSDPFPRFFWLKQNFDAPSISDPIAATREAMVGLPASRFIRAGMAVAIGAGSRGIANYDVIVRTVCEELKKLGAQPFVVPAMGSHGGATAEGQRDVLARYGISEQTMGVPVRSSMEVVELGRTGQFIVYQDKNAHGADAIVLVNRIKPHTDFHGPVESGLMKMAAIGLGKQAGARQFHQAGVRTSQSQALLAIAREVLRLSKIAFGVGIIENQFHQTARVVALPAATVEQEETKLLTEARRLMPRLPFDAVDLLIVDEMGKNISGTGLDTNVVRREAQGGFLTPAPNAVRRIYVRSLHPDSSGNATGVGIADFIHERLYRAIDTKAMWVNSITALNTVNARIPIWFPTDREAVEAALYTTGLTDARRVKALWIKNTLSCQRLLASESYLEETHRRSDLHCESDPAPLAFDERGDLFPVF